MANVEITYYGRLADKINFCPIRCSRNLEYCFFLFYLFVLISRLLYLLVEPYATLILDDDEELHGKSHDSRIGPCPSRDPLRTCQNDLKTNEQREPNGDGLNFRIIKIEKMRLRPCAH